MYPAPAGWPQDIPGLEYAGVVDAVGEGLTRWNVGARVMGIVGGGGYAEYVVVHEREAIAVPEGLSLHEAAAIPEVFITAHDALFTQLGLAVGERLLIHAVGSGVGTAALQLTKAAGVFVFGTSRSAWKLERARALGLDVAIDVSREDFATVVARETRGEGVHAILDLVGAPYLQRNLEALAVKGRMIVVGLTAGNSGPIELGVLLRKRLRVVGTSLRTRTLDEKITAAQRFEGEVVPQFAAGRVKPVVDAVFPMERASEAHRRMEENANFGKIVMQTRPG